MSILIFFAVLALLVLTHEFGHFIFAKISGVKVEEFGFGFPPKLFSFRKGETIYSLNLIPFGGFVKIYGEDGAKDGDANKKSFAGKKIPVRALIIAAGVLFNFVLIWPVLTTAYLVGAPISAEDRGFYGGSFSEKGVIILQVQDNTSAEKAGLEAGDYLLRFYSQVGEVSEIKDVKDVQDFIAKNAGSEITIDYRRAGKDFAVKTIPSRNPESGKGSLGIAMDKIGFVRLPFYSAVWEGLKSSAQLVKITFQSLLVFFKDIFTERKMISQVSGPVGIAGLVSNASHTGFVFILQILAILSVNLAFINLLPLPALDGGRLFFLLVEFVRRKPISQKVMGMANNISFAALIILMLIITYRDILRLF